MQSRPDYDPAVKLRPVNGAYLRESDPLIDEDELMDLEPELPITSLPILATANDAREVIRFLKKRPNGVTVVEAMNAEPKRIFDARKVAAYEFWGIIHRQNDRLTLTPLGQELAEALGPETRMHRDILNRVPAYKLALKCIYDEGLDIATHLDVLRHWSELRTVAGVEYGNAQDLEAAVVCFFSLCHAAELGTSTVGKRGQPARLRVEIEQVAAFLSESYDVVSRVPISLPAKLPQRDNVQPFRSTPGGTIRRVLVSTSGVRTDVDHLNSLLRLAGFESSTIDFADFDNGLIPSSELAEMQQCQAGIFVISPKDCVKQKDGTHSLRHEWITKISVAAAIFDWRILLFWNGKLPPPEELSSSGLKILSSEDLDWQASVDLVSHLKELA
ncbi:MAG: hypothetical protein HOP17_12505 [Acidobacteria bacterium]|nr:hypothetical protein [Acidobacteriota bacterium]